MASEAVINPRLFSRLFFQFGMGLILSSAIGCGDGLILVKVQGKVTIGGTQPFSNGIVRFTPKSGGKNPGAVAATDDEGKYQLKYQGQRPGIEPGEYNVSFSLWKMPDGSDLPSQDGENEPKSAQELGGMDFVPAEFASINSSKNPVTVSKKGGTFDFNIPELNKPKKKKK